MQRIACANKNNAGVVTSRPTYYRCTPPHRAPSKCRNMVPTSVADGWIERHLTDPAELGAVPVIERVVTPGSGHDEAIADVDAQLRDLDPDAEDYDERHAALRAERKRIKAEPATPTRVEWRASGQTYAEVWRGLDVRGRRHWLARHGAKLAMHRDGDSFEFRLDLAVPGLDAQALIDQINQ
jgi:hypothetical protein